VGKVGKPKRALWKSLPIWLMTIELKRRNLVQKAPTYALIEVNDDTVEAFNRSTGALDKDFDTVVVLWGSMTESPQLSKKFVVVAKSEEGLSRWSLLENCSDGFVFPLEAGSSRDKAQQAQLKSQLFKFGGHCIVSFANLAQYFDAGEPLSDTFAGPVLVAAANVNEMVFDERFLNLRTQKIHKDSETADLARLARSSGTPILAIQSVNQGHEGVLLPSLPATNNTRADLIELLLRNPKLAKVVNVRIARLWASVWAALGYPVGAKVHEDQVRTLATHRAAGKPKRDELTRARASLKALAGGR
jgi:hypothetical protein